MTKETEDTRTEREIIKSIRLMALPVTEPEREGLKMWLNPEYAPNQHRVDVSRDLIRRLCAALTSADAEAEESHEIGKRDGYEEAVAHIDRLTGGDGEYRFCTNGDPERHTPDHQTMTARIVERFTALASSAAETARLREELEREWQSRFPPLKLIDALLMQSLVIVRNADNECPEAIEALETVRDNLRHIAAQLQSAEAEKEAMRVEAMKVLEPFAKAARASSVMEGRSGDCYKLAQNGSRIAFMDLRKAASFLASLSLKEGKDAPRSQPEPL